MRNLFKIFILAMFLVGAASGVFAHEQTSIEIDLDAGMTFFEVNGEEFVVVTTEKLTIVFGGVNRDQVFGLIDPCDGVTFEEQIKFVWLKQDSDPVTLFLGKTMGRVQNFDSEVTGHNEKGD